MHRGRLRHWLLDGELEMQVVRESAVSQQPCWDPGSGRMRRVRRVRRMRRMCRALGWAGQSVRRLRATPDALSSFAMAGLTASSHSQKSGHLRVTAEGILLCATAIPHVNRRDRHAVYRCRPATNGSPLDSPPLISLLASACPSSLRRRCNCYQTPYWKLKPAVSLVCTLLLSSLSSVVQSFARVECAAAFYYIRPCSHTFATVTKRATTLRLLPTTTSSRDVATPSLPRDLWSRAWRPYLRFHHSQRPPEHTTTFLARSGRGNYTPLSAQGVRHPSAEPPLPTHPTVS